MVQKFKINEEAFRKLRTSEAAYSMVEQAAQRVAAAAGPGFVVKRGRGANRARAVVVPTTPEAYRANAKNLAVVRALSSI